MKIILKPSDPAARHAPPIISISVAGDHFTVPDVLEKIIVPALVAWGFHPDSIYSAMGDLADSNTNHEPVTE
jgi:hypothetical protein